MKLPPAFTRFLFLFLFVLISIPNTQAQQKTDSLKSVLQTPLSDSAHQRILLGIAKVYNGKVFDSAIHYTDLLLSYAASKHNKFLCAEAYTVIGYTNYIKGNYEASLQAYSNMYKVAESLNDVKSMGYALNNEANVYIEKGQYARALANYNKCVKLAEDNKDEYGVARAYNNIAYVCKEQGKFEEAIEGYVNVLKVYDRLGKESDYPQCYNNMAYVYMKQGNYSKAAEYCLKAIPIQKKYDQGVGLGISYSLLGSIYGEQQKNEEAVSYFKEAQAIHRNAKDIRQEAVSYANIAELYARSRSFDSAVSNYRLALELNRKMGNNRELPHSYIGLAGALISLNKYDEAHDMLDSANRLLKVTPKKETTKMYLNILSDYYYGVGKNKEALEAYKEYVSVKDSLLNEQNAKNISEISTRYETEKKELQIVNLNRESSIKDLTIQNQKLSLDKRLYELAKKALQLSDANLKVAKGELLVNSQQKKILSNQLDSAKAQQDLYQLGQKNRLQALTLENQQLLLARKNMILVVSAIIFALVLLWVYGAYNRSRLKQQARTQLLLMKQQEIAAREIITAEENERKRIAGDLHDGVGQIMSAAKMNLSAVQSQLTFTSDEQRLFFESAIKMVDDGCKEVRVISHNMMPNALLKAGLAAAIREFVNMIPDRVLRVQLHAEGLDEKLDHGIETVLYRVVQECVQNVIKHAGATTLDISLIKDNSGIDIMVEDNGRGFDTSRVGNNDGLGTGNMMKRISYLKGTIEWSSTPGKGTLVSIHIPVS
ncbi:MAG: Signal transduction histidine kinase [Flavipsychrobacter sp.]|nr:Signal transduction histidine kinase [Flavipsychrobacter sp.]